MKNVSRLIIAVAALCTVVDAAIWYVHPDSTLNSIQTALNSCSAGDTVLVGPGVYFENIVWPNTQGIDLVSEYGPDTTIIDAASTAGRAIEITIGVDPTTVISSFTIRNGYIGDNGAGIYCLGASPTITDNIITANHVYGGYNGGAIACCYNSSPVIHANTISGNHSVLGGAILCYNGCAPIITANVIDNNEADSLGGGICCWVDCNPLIEGNVITGNEAYWGGGIGAVTLTSPTVRNNTISSNYAVWSGGGIYCYNLSDPLIEDNEISNNNNGIDDYGAGIRCGVNTSPVIRHCRISANPNVGLSIDGSPDIDSCIIELHNTGIKIFAGANPTINWCNIVDNSGYGLINQNASVTINAESNWWGDITGPYHSSLNPSGLGDRIAGNVDFDPWLMASVQGIGVEESLIVTPVGTPYDLGATIFRGPLQLPEGRTCRVFDITGRVVRPEVMKPGIYFIEIDGVVTRKVVKVR